MGSDHRENVGGTAGKKVGRRRTMEELRSLGHQLLSSRAHINNLPVLLAALSSAASSPKNGKALECLLSLQSFFTPLVADLPPSSSKHGGAGAAPEDAEAVYRTWLRAHFDQFVTALVEICAASELDDDVKVGF